MQRQHAAFIRPPAARVAAAAMAALLLCAPPPARAQAGAAPDPREAQPERPTVATHAYAVAPGVFEVEAGFQDQREGALGTRLSVPLLLKIGLVRNLQLDLAPGWLRDSATTGSGEGLTDLLVGVKWRLTDAAPVINDFALQVGVSLPTGSAQSGRGSGEPAIGLLVISSRTIGPVSLDINVAYTRLGGESTFAPRNSTMWAVAAGVAVTRRIGWDVEFAGYPGTSGPQGAPPVVQFLAGPTFTVRPSVVLDAGAVFDVVRFGGTAIYGGLTWNVGRAWGGPPPPARATAGRPARP
jgi:hypothetical protein